MHHSYVYLAAAVIILGIAAYPLLATKGSGGGSVRTDANQGSCAERYGSGN